MQEPALAASRACTPPIAFASGGAESAGPLRVAAARLAPLATVAYSAAAQLEAGTPDLEQSRLGRSEDEVGVPNLDERWP